MIHTIAFDADDTLWDNESYYTRAKEYFVRQLSPYGELEALTSRLDQIEIGNVEIYGYGIKSFVLSMIETAIEVSAGQIRGADLQPVLDIAREMLRAEVQFYEQVVETLQALSGRYPLMMITKGDLFEQELKIIRSGLRPYFKYVEIVGNKTEASYQHILQRYSLQPDGFLMVGNSMRSDILPVLKLGGMAVYIPQANTWSHENTAETPSGQNSFFTLEYIWQLPELLLKLDSP
jgi:putative hydrolase of the HAD superfamily